MALRFNTVILTILLFTFNSFGQSNGNDDKKRQSKFAKKESRAKCSCFKQIIKDVIREEKRSMRKPVKADKNGYPIIKVGGPIDFETCFARKRKPDLVNFINNLDSLETIKFEKAVIRNIKSICPKQFSEAKKFGYIPK